MGALIARATAGALLGVIALAGTAHAQSAPPPGLECRLELSAAEAKLGDTVTCTVTLVNHTDGPLKVVMPDLDFHSVSLRFEWLEPLPPAPDPPTDGDGDEPGADPDGDPKADPDAPEPTPRPTHRRREVRIERHAPSFTRPRPVDERTLPSGESLACEIVCPMIFAGDVQITALYYGFGLSKQLGVPVSGHPLPSVPAAVAGAPSPNGRLGATLETALGSLEVELYPHIAPNHVFNFLALAHSGFFDDSFIPRVKSGFVVQAGSPEPHTAGNPGFTIPPEFSDTKHVRGVLSMARGGHPFTAGSQFFICLAPAPQLDLENNRGMGYTVFGRMITGDETLQKLESVKVERGPSGEASQPVEQLTMKTITPFAR